MLERTNVNPWRSGKFKARPMQREILDADERFRTAVLHRRCGKTAMSIQDLVTGVETCKLERPRGFYLGTTLAQVEKVAWNMLLDATPKWDHDTYRRRAKHPSNDGTIELISATKYQGHRGTYCDRLVVDEVDLIPPSAFDAVFRPALADRLGKALFIGTPLGKGHLYDRYNNAFKSSNWASWKLTAYQTGIIHPDELADLCETMPEADFAREMLCDFDAALPGAYYAKPMNWLREQSRIRPQRWLPEDGVTASWYFGKTDSIVVTFWQKGRDDSQRCIDALWFQETDLEEIVATVDAKPYHYARHVAPGDAVRTVGTRIAQIRHLNREFNLRPAPKLDLMDRVYRTKQFLKRCEFPVTDGNAPHDARGDSVEALRQYRADYDEVNKRYDEKPVQNWTLDFAGSVEAFATDHNDKRTDWTRPIDYAADAEAA